MEHVHVFAETIPALHVRKLTRLFDNTEDFFSCHYYGEGGEEQVLPIAEWTFEPMVTFSFNIIMSVGRSRLIRQDFAVPEALAHTLATYQRQDTQWSELPYIKARILGKIETLVKEFVGKCTGEAVVMRQTYDEIFKAAKKKVPACIHLPLANDNDGAQKLYKR